MIKTNSIEILITEDDQLITTLQKKQLEKLVTIPIQTFWNGRELLSYIEKNEKEVETFLILLDINMPLMNGWEVLERINKLYKHKNILVVMLTSSIYPEDKQKAFTFPQVISFNDKFLDLEDFNEILNHRSLKEIIELHYLPQ